MKTLKIALDWTPNINHIGFFVANEKGFYEKYGIDLEIVSPLVDDYAMTPGKKLELGLVDFAIAPFETVISLNNKANTVDAIAIYTLLQEDLSCIATLKNKNISRPKQLNLKTYASYKARYEDAIVRQMVINDRGKGDLKIVYPEKLGIWNTLLEGEADATWIFDNWEGIEADAKGVRLNKFYLNDYAIPYGYSPIILTKRHQLEDNQALFRAFVKATQLGFKFAQNHPDESISILVNYLTPYDQANVPLKEALRATAPYFSRYGSYGFMQPERVRLFIEWLVRHKLEDDKILSQTLYTNGLFA